MVSTPEVIPFRSKSLLLVEHNGEPFVPMKPLVEGMGLAWQTQHRKLQSGRFKAVVTEMVITAADGKRYDSCCLPLRKLPGWLMSIHPNKVNPALREGIIAFQNECDDVLWAHWNKTHAPAATTSTLRFRGAPFRINWLGGNPWFSMVDVAGALRLESVAELYRRLPAYLLGKQMVEGHPRKVVGIPGLVYVLEAFPGERASDLQHWLTHFAGIDFDPQPAQARELMEERLLTSRFLVHFDHNGRMVLQELEPGVAYIAATQVVEHIASQCALSLLPGILQSVATRLQRV